MTAKNKTPKPSFEEALDSLEKTITLLESPDLSLDDSLKYFEAGVAQIRTCETHLKKAEGKVTELLKGKNGAIVEKTLGITLESFITKEPSDE